MKILLFFSPQHRLLQYKQGTECAERLMGTTEVGNLTYALSHHIYTNTLTHTQVFINAMRKGSTLAWTCLHFTLPQSLRITWNMHITNKLCIHWTRTVTHIHPHTHSRSLSLSLIHTNSCQSPFCAPAGDPAVVMSLLAATLLIVTLIESRALWFSFKSGHCAQTCAPIHTLHKH